MENENSRLQISRTIYTAFQLSIDTCLFISNKVFCFSPPLEAFSKVNDFICSLPVEYTCPIFCQEFSFFTL